MFTTFLCCFSEETFCRRGTETFPRRFSHSRRLFARCCVECHPRQKSLFFFGKTVPLRIFSDLFSDSLAKSWGRTGRCLVRRLRFGVKQPNSCRCMFIQSFVIFHRFLCCLFCLLLRLLRWTPSIAPVQRGCFRQSPAKIKRKRVSLRFDFAFLALLVLYCEMKTASGFTVVHLRGFGAAR